MVTLEAVILYSSVAAVTDTDIPKIEDLPEEVAFWKSYREICRNKEIDTVKLYMDLAEEEKRKLGSPGAREEYIELCEAGCFQPVLAGIVMLLRYAPRLEAFWTQMVGRPDNREKASLSLESATQTLENLFSGVIESENEGKIPELERIGRLPVSRVINELRFYIRLVNSASSISSETEIRSPTELAKYLVSSYVRRMTGRFHDRSVSGLVGEVSGPCEYNEVAHRMWRTRNYDRIDKHFSWMTRFLVAMSVVIAQTP
jgi:hypothetical protein